MPPLNEGAILYMPTAPPGMSATEAARVLQAMDRELRAVPGGGARVRQDRAAPRPRPTRRRSRMVETVVVLKPRVRVARGA